MPPDATIAVPLAEYVGSRSQTAFAELVTRHVDLVYATARRIVGDSHVAEDVTQATFIVLARKAHSVDPRYLAGWLVKTTRLAAKQSLRSQGYRHKHETRVAYQHASASIPREEPTAEEIAPILDEALSHLNDLDRTAVVLRFLEGRSFPQIGQTIGVTEEAARKRVTRALEKLRTIFLKKGYVPSVGGLAIALAAHQATASPLPLAATATTGVTTKAGTGYALAQGVITAMLWTKLKWMLVVCLLSLATVGGGVIVAQSVSPTAAPPAPQQTGTTTPDADLKQAIQGRWRALEVWDNGDRATLDMIEDMRMTIDERTMAIKMKGREMPAPYTIDTSHSPAWIDLQMPGMEAVLIKGLVEMNNGLLRMVLPSGPGERSTAFESRQHPLNNNYFIMEREDAPAPPLAACVELWQAGKQDEARTRFVATDWATQYRADEPMLSLQETFFVSLREHDRARYTNEVNGYIQPTRELVRAVIDAAKSESEKDLLAVAAFGRRLREQDGKLLIWVVVGRGVSKAALTELVQVYGDAGQAAKLKWVQEELAGLEKEVAAP